MPVTPGHVASDRDSPLTRGPESEVRRQDPGPDLGSGSEAAPSQARRLGGNTEKAAGPSGPERSGWLPRTATTLTQRCRSGPPRPSGAGRPSETEDLSILVDSDGSPA